MLLIAAFPSRASWLRVAVPLSHSVAALAVLEMAFYSLLLSLWFRGCPGATLASLGPEETCGSHANLAQPCTTIITAFTHRVRPSVVILAPAQVDGVEAVVCVSDQLLGQCLQSSQLPYVSVSLLFLPHLQRRCGEGEFASLYQLPQLRQVYPAWVGQ